MAKFAQKIQGLPRGYVAIVLDKLALKKIFISPWKVYKVACGVCQDEEILSLILEVKLEALLKKKDVLQKNEVLKNEIKKLEESIQ